MPERFTLPNVFANTELERGLLAAIAAKPGIYWEISDQLPVEAFTEGREAFEELGEAIQQEKPLPKIEGKPVLQPEQAARELSRLYQKRLLAGLAQNFLERLHAETSPGELIAELENGLASVQQAVRELRTGQAVSLPDLLRGLLPNVKARRQAVKERGVAAVGLPTGITNLDKLLGGLQPGVHLLAAEPGRGKTTFCLQVAAHVAVKGYPVLFVSFEETLARLALKVICAREQLQAKEFWDGHGDPAELEEAIREHERGLAPMHFIEGAGPLTVPQVKARALQVMARVKADRCLVVIDYLQRWAAGRREFSEFRHVVSGLVSELRQLAFRLDSPVIVVSSQNRPGQGTAHLTSLKESGDLEYSADTAMFLVDAQKLGAAPLPPARAVDLVLEKNRYGNTGRVKLVFKPDIGVFREQAGE